MPSVTKDPMHFELGKKRTIELCDPESGVDQKLLQLGSDWLGK